MTGNSTVLDIMAVAALVPGALLFLRAKPERDWIFWVILAVGFLGPFLWISLEFASAWRTDVSAAMWISIAVTIGLFALISLFDAESWQLAPVLAPLMFVLAVLAAIWSSLVEAKTYPDGDIAWLGIHIAVSVATYALLTIAAVAAVAAIVQDRALKRKQPTNLTRALPSISSCDALMFRLLVFSEVVLACGLFSGMAVQYGDSGVLLAFDHKTILALVTFTLIGVVLIAHYKSGLRGRKAARWALSAYLFLTLAYPGVKLVTDVILV